MNDLVERYLNSIKRLLPHGQQEDITAELSDAIQSRIEEKEAELGRKLKPAEIEAILKALGSPMQVAARYGSNRYLIGPAIFPAWWLAVRVVLLVVLAAGVVGAVIRNAVGLARGEPISLIGSMMQTFGDLMVSAFFVVGVITVIAVIIERTHPELADGTWPFEKLGSLPRPHKDRRRTRRRWSRVDAAFGLAVNLVFFVWLAGYIASPDAYPAYLSLEHWIETTGIALAPIWWDELFKVMLAGIAGQAVLHLVMLCWPTSQRRFAAAKILNDAIAVVFAALVLQAGQLFLAAPGLEGDAKVGDVLRGINLAMRLAFAITGAIGALDAIWQLWRLFGPRSPGSAQDGSPAPRSALR